MGGLCSRNSAVDKSPSDAAIEPHGLYRYPEQMLHGQKAKGDVGNSSSTEVLQMRLQGNAFPFSERVIPACGNGPANMPEDTEQLLSRAPSNRSMSTRSKAAASSKAVSGKVSEVSLILGKAGTAGLGKAVEVLDTLGSTMTNLHISSGFVSGATAKRQKISILAFEVANTIVKGFNLMQSLTEENVRHLKEVVIPSEGVQKLVSKDTDELLRIAAADKREELNLFCKEVIRFGNRCKDPQWHNLDRYFDKLSSEIVSQNQLKEAADTIMKQLMTTVQHTAELYHELHTLDRYEQDSRRKNLEEDSPTAVQRGDNHPDLKQELKSQRKHVKGLKKRSLWSRHLEEVLEKLVEVVHFLHLEILNAFRSAAETDVQAKGSIKSHKKLGPAGLALHYANIITQIDTLVSRSGSIPLNTKDSLYHGLPPKIRNGLRSRLQALHTKEELTIAQIKDEMGKTLGWLVPFANNTTKAHHGFGWVGEWANAGAEMNQKASGLADFIVIETLHYADKEKTEAYILELVVWLHLLISRCKSSSGGIKSPINSPVSSPLQKCSTVSSAPSKPSTSSSVLTQEDEEMLRYVTSRKLIPGISKSQEFDRVNLRSSSICRLSKSNSHSPASSSLKDFLLMKRPSMVPILNFEIDRIKALDVIDRVDNV